MLLSWLVSNRLKNKFELYSKLQLQNGMSGAEIAEKMLADHGITDVKVISTPGQLTDHYNPMDKTVNLSEAVYNQRNAAAAAGHARGAGQGRGGGFGCDAGFYLEKFGCLRHARGGLRVWRGGGVGAGVRCSR